MTKEESKMIMMALALRHNLPDVGLENYLKAIDLHLPDPVHHSKYKFLKTFPYPEFEQYYYCYDCGVLLDFGNGTHHTCEYCEQMYSKLNLKREGQFFMYIPLKKQLIDFLNGKDYKHFGSIPGDVNDIVNAKVYKKLQAKNIIRAYDITLTWNTDGVNFFKSSKKSMYPLLAVINELPYRIRRNNMLLCGLWNDARKPIMNVFLEPFANELVELSKGFESTTLIHKEPILIRVHTFLSSVDSVARPTIQNVKQFNGKYGCPYCFHKGKHVRVKRGSARVYCGKKRRARTLRVHKKLVKKSVQKKKVIKGVKGPSIMSSVPNFNIVRSLPPEYLHSSLLGTGKSFITEMFDSHNSTEDWYLGPHLQTFNARLVNAMPPCEITRASAPLDKITKASQWKSLICYYSIPCFEGLMRPKYLKHWFLYVFSLHIYLKDKATDEELQLAKKAIYQFVEEIEGLYGETFMKFNAHILLHIPHFVELYGNLWAWSAFPFEHYNGVIKQLFHGTQCIPEQICKQYHRLRYVKMHSDIFDREDCNYRVQSFYTSLMNQCRIKNCIEYGDSLRLFGKPKNTSLSVVEKIVIEERLQERVKEKCQMFQRFIFKNTLFHSNNYKRLKKRNNSYVLMNNNSLISISSVVGVQGVSSEETKYVLLGLMLNISNEDVCKNGRFTSKLFSFVAEQTSTIVCYEVSCISSKCVGVPYKDKFCIFPLVNKVETD